MDGQNYTSSTFRLKTVTEDEPNLFGYRIIEYEQRRFWSAPFKTIYSAWVITDPVEEVRQLEAILGGMTLISIICNL